MGNKMILTVASGNEHKIKEMNGINPFSEILLKKIDTEFNPIENGLTFEENAIIKAKAASKIIHDYSLADDSGLCIDYLNGAPGIYTARYAPSQSQKIDRVLNELKNIPFEKRKAHFSCCMVLTDKNENVIHKTIGRIDGYIAFKKSGNGGFGYDPIFYVPKYNLTLAELPENEKNKISHRYNALLPMLQFIKTKIAS
jgi:XTP/dITP diphosphohydrolase